ncbi:efflux RND transporter periplasmic adaptor subunit [Candidatus Vondammii sp. HM_W22]|uniref:efflux RND transporter periplasmic adaptor subunit n=1 Tax=Candidatus Vondammii sp. HM_W22 TaxID=2687299 RepID=UPI0024029362|nr:efflux RND transporter periplasmic adaptor subunit [Candidatus Vondammii sp. HM_W22]
MKYPRLLLFPALLLPLLSLAAETPPAKVVVATVQEREITETSQMIGVIDFDRISMVSGEISGLITQQLVSEGQRVKKGDPLVVLNTDLIQKDIDIKAQQRAQVSAEIEKMSRSLHRLESLLKKNSASIQSYDDARFEHRSLIKKRDTLDQEAERLKLQLVKSVVRAPFDGVVLEKHKEQGEWLSLGTSVCKLASTQDLVAKVAISERLMRYQQTGTRLPISIAALSIQAEGKIKGFSPVADLRSKSAVLKIELPYQRGMVQNMSVSIEVPTGKKQLLRLVPRDAVVRIKGKEFAYSLIDGKAKLMPLEIVARTFDAVAVAKPPIKVGMSVVIDGNDRLRPDQAITVVER